MKITKNTKDEVVTVTKKVPVFHLELSAKEFATILIMSGNIKGNDLYHDLLAASNISNQHIITTNLSGRAIRSYDVNMISEVIIEANS